MLKNTNQFYPPLRLNFEFFLKLELIYYNLEFSDEDKLGGNKQSSSSCWSSDIIYC